MSILPSFFYEEIKKQSEAGNIIEIPKEYGVDFKTGQLTGNIVEGKEAIKVWIWNCMHTERFRYAIYSWQYGVEFEQYLGETLPQEYFLSDCEAVINEALSTNPYITGISDFNASLSGSILRISFTAETTLGNVEVDTDV